MSWRKVSVLGVLLVLGVVSGRGIVACGGGTPPVRKLGDGGGSSSVSGVVTMGPVSAGTVTAYKLDDQMIRGAALATATTDAAGAFTLALPSYNGALLIVASSGSYIEESIGLGVRLDGHELTLVIPSYQAGAQLAGQFVTPISTLATSLATFHVQQKHEALAAALASAFTHLNAHFGLVDWRTTSPEDLTAGSVANLDPGATEGLVLAALSWEARTISTAAGVPPGTQVNAITLVDVLSKDLSDGTLDGLANGKALMQATTTLTGQTMRKDLAQAMTAFVASNRNTSRLDGSAVASIAYAVQTDTDAYLFSGTVVKDVTPPVIVWDSPPADGGVSGAASVHLHATDDSAIASFTISSNVSVADGGLTFSDVGCAVGVTHCNAMIAGTLDVSALPDGPLMLTADSADAYGNAAHSTLQVLVANHGPRISVTQPSDGAVLKGAVTLVATAQPGQSGAAVTSLALVSPPPGMGADQLPAADSFSATWDTTQALEGPTQLHFRATDALGGQTELLVSVVVDNVPFGQIVVTLGAGAPVAGATVQVFALNDADGGLELLGDGGAALMGQGGPTAGPNDPSGLPPGRALVVLTAENRAHKPIRIVASPPAGSSLSYLDPADPADAGPSPVTISSAFQFETTIADYSTGQAITVPVGLWTTVADAAAAGYFAAHGNQLTRFTQAMAVTDPILADHFSPVSVHWNLRTTVPVDLTNPPTQSLRDAAYAAFPEVALNQLARDLSAGANVGPDQVITAISLTQLLQQDLSSDALFDGLGFGAQLQTLGSPPYSLDANTTRFKLAIALDGFIRSSRNASGLHRQDLLNAGIYDRMAQDTSILYPANQQPIAFDTTPPTVTVSAVYQLADGGPSQPPVTSSKLVGGTVTLTVDATDLSGVASTSVAVNGIPLTLPPTGNTPSHVVASWSTTANQTPDGPLTFAITSVDRLGNSGTTNFSVVVDNTPPTVTQAAPSTSASLWYSAAVPFDLTATDASSVASLAQAAGGAFAGLVDTDSSPAHFAGSWPAPGNTEQPVSSAFQACDVVGNCLTYPVSVHVDTVAPSLQLGTAPPQYTAASSVTIQVLAIDQGSGVQAAYFKSASAGTIQGTVNGVFYQASVPLTTGNNNLSIWGVDNASPSNSGQNAPLTLTIVRETTAPTPSLVTTASYSPENASVGVQTDSSGVPVVPPIYTGLGSKVGLTDGSSYKKFSNRLSDPGVTAATLEGANPNNTGFLQVQIPHDATSQSPISSVKFTVACIPGTGPAGPCPSTATINGALLLSPSSTSALLKYDLPLTQELFPRALLEHPAGFTVTIKATSAVGNVGSVTATIYPAVIAPPLVAVEDTNYANVGDLLSSYPYRTTNSSYAQLFGGPNAPFVAGAVRLRRYLVYNPYSVPLAVYSNATNPTYQFNENWNTPLFQMPPNTQLSMGSVGNIPSTNFWAYNSCSVLPCSNGPVGFPTTPVMSSSSPGNYACSDSAQYPGPDTNTPYQAFINARLSTQAFVNPTQTGGETSPAPTSDQGAPIVSAASGSTPGVIVVYVVRATSTPRQATAPYLNYQGLDPSHPSQAYFQNDLALYWVQGMLDHYCVVNGFQHNVYQFQAWRKVQRINTSAEQVAFTLNIGVVGLIGGNTEDVNLGPDSRSSPAVSFIINH